MSKSFEFQFLHSLHSYSSIYFFYEQMFWIQNNVPLIEIFPQKGSIKDKKIIRYTGLRQCVWQIWPKIEKKAVRDHASLPQGQNSALNSGVTENGITAQMNSCPGRFIGTIMYNIYFYLLQKEITFFFSKIRPSILGSGAGKKKYDYVVKPINIIGLIRTQINTISSPPLILSESFRPPTGSFLFVCVCD